ncbi:MAG: hypothetical protein ABII12_12465 [Planctomycetota bacterium]
MTAAGWTVMILSVGSVFVLMSYCLFRVLSLPPVEVEEVDEEGRGSSLDSTGFRK